MNQQHPGIDTGRRHNENAKISTQASAKGQAGYKRIIIIFLLIMIRVRGSVSIMRIVSIVMICVAAVALFMPAMSGRTFNTWACKKIEHTRAKDNDRECEEGRKQDQPGILI